MRLDDGRVVPNFVVSAIKGKKISLYRDGNQTRTFCYISDATVGWIKTLLSPESERVFNIGNDDQEIKMRHLAEMVLGLVGNKKSTIEYVGETMAIYATKTDPDRRCPDLTRSRDLLGYNPKTNLIYGMKRFIRWAEDELKDQEENELEKIV